jgi:hypothetical protein
LWHLGSSKRGEPNADLSNNIRQDLPAVMGMLDRKMRQVRAMIIPKVKRSTLQEQILNHVEGGSQACSDLLAVLCVPALLSVNSPIGEQVGAVPLFLVIWNLLLFESGCRRNLSRC